jgi:hypothetical protein
VGKSPSQRAQEAAKGAVDTAMEQQKDITADIYARADTYVDKTTKAQKELETLFGATGADYAKQATQGFYSTLGNINAKYENQLKNYQPNLIGSSSYNALTDSLKQSAGEFGQGVKKTSEEGASRLYQTLAAPLVGFQAISTDPAFNLQYDPRSMGLAAKPPTVRSDVDSMKQLYTYNV